MDRFEIYDEGFIGCKRLLKNGKAINEFGMLKEVEKRDMEIAILKDALDEISECNCLGEVEKVLRRFGVDK